ncbi:MAG: nickel-responsive transcriptional regulator NikR [Candidatus Diapherotrites archaeon]|nr:nickel-responsive transcriptional regulator NikR [Candidatus Diapherotrites archaeon]
MEKVKRMAVSLPAELAGEFEKAIARKAYSNRSKAVADVFREYLSKIEWQKDGNAVGAITILYDHHKRGVTDRLTELQHDYGSLILSSLHVHLDHNNCLEVIVAKGNAKQIESLANSLISASGVKQGKLASLSFH